MLTRRSFLLSAAAACVACTRTSTDRPLRVAAGDTGGLYYAFASILAERVHLLHPDVAVNVVATEGTVENLARLRSGDVHVGLALADVAELDRATGPSPSALTAVARVYENYLQVIVRDTSAVQQLSDLRGARVSIGPTGSGGAMTSEVLFEATGMTGDVDLVRLRLNDGLVALADGRVDAIVWSGGVPTPAITEVDATVPLRMLDIRSQATPLRQLAGYPYVVRRVPSGSYVPAGVRSFGVPSLLMCREDVDADVVAVMVDVLATQAPHLVPPSVRGLQYLNAPSMIQTGLIPLHPGAVTAYRRLHG